MLSSKGETATKAQIGYSYDDDGSTKGSGNYSSSAQQQRKKSPSPDPLDEEGLLDDDLDMQVDLKSLTSEHKHILNKHATEYGMEYGDYIRMITLDHEEKEALKRNKLLEAEKAQYSVITYSLFLDFIHVL